MPDKVDVPTKHDNEAASSDKLISELYTEIRRLAKRERWRAGRPDSLQTTAIMHEAYLKLYRQEHWESRQHFLGAAVTAMRHILVDAARARLTAKRGGGGGHLPISAASNTANGESEDIELVRLADALRDLAELDPKLAQLVDCRFFAGLTESEAAQLMGVTDRTIQRWWKQARAWIHSELEIAA